MKRGIILVPMLALPLVVTSCGNLADDASSSASFALGDALAGTNAAQFSAGKAAFNTSENAAAYLNTL